MGRLDKNCGTAGLYWKTMHLSIKCSETYKGISISITQERFDSGGGFRTECGYAGDGIPSCACFGVIKARFMNTTLPTYSGVPRISLSSPTAPSLRARPKSTIFMSPGGHRLVRRMFCGWERSKADTHHGESRSTYFKLITQHESGSLLNPWSIIIIFALQGRGVYFSVKWLFARWKTPWAHDTVQTLLELNYCNILYKKSYCTYSTARAPFVYTKHTHVYFVVLKPISISCMLK